MESFYIILQSLKIVCPEKFQVQFGWDPVELFGAYTLHRNVSNDLTLAGRQARFRHVIV